MQIAGEKSNRTELSDEDEQKKKIILSFWGW